MDKLVDSIVGQILGQAAADEPAKLNRPNYQRKARPCSAAEKSVAAVPPPFPTAGGRQEPISVDVFIFHTGTGIHISAVGQNPEAVASVGVSVLRTRYIALLISGILSGFGGCFMSMGYMNGFTANMVSGRGFIGLAANSMGQNAPLGTLVAALIFGIADAAANNFQLLRVPTQFIQIIPYATTLIGITIYSIKRSGDRPAGGRRFSSHL